MKFRETYPGFSTAAKRVRRGRNGGSPAAAGTKPNTLFERYGNPTEDPMKAPMTSNSITDRVIYTGLYVPDHAGDGERDEDARTDAAAPVSEEDGLQL